jgi:hypothetical protein
MKRTLTQILFGFVVDIGVTGLDISNDDVFFGKW